MGDGRSPALISWLAQFVRDASTDDQIERFVTRVDEGILRQNPEIAADQMLIVDLHNSTRSQWRAFLVTLVEPEHRSLMTETAIELARSVARRGLELGVLLKIYRAGQQALFGYLTELTEAVRPGDPGRDRVLVDIWNRADRWLDEGIEGLIAVYYEERRRLHEGAQHRKAETITAILAGAALQTTEASRALGHPVHAWQTAFVSWTTAETHGRPDAAYTIAAAAAEALGTYDPLTMAAGSRDLWFWAATDDCPELGALASLRGLLEQSATQHAVGVPAQGVQGFRNSHEEARAAQALAISATSSLDLVLYQDVELLCLTSGNQNLARRMVQRELGALARADKNTGLIRETVLAYFDSALNVEATAQRLHVHKNTVRYRLARAEELVGHGLSQGTAQLELALRYVSMFGPVQVLSRQD
jgi:DNA-binding PucR family transcriptional regulator